MRVVAEGTPTWQQALAGWCQLSRHESAPRRGAGHRAQPGSGHEHSPPPLPPTAPTLRVCAPRCGWFCLCFPPWHHTLLRAESPTPAGPVTGVVLLPGACEREPPFGAEVLQQQCHGLWPVLGTPCPMHGQTHPTANGGCTGLV